MSVHATRLVYEEVIPGTATTPPLRQRLDAWKATLNPKERRRAPGFGITRSTLAYLADRYRPKRKYTAPDGSVVFGFVDESRPQIARALGDSEDVVKNALWALDQLGLAPVLARGNRHTPTKRRMPFAEEEHRLHGEADLTEKPDLHGEIDDLHGEISDLHGEISVLHGEASLTTPPYVSPVDMSPVEEEGGALESRDIYAIARSLVRPYPERRAEIDKLLDDCDRHYGEDLTETAILDLFAERHDQTPLDYKSDLATLLTDKLDELHERSPASLVPADHPPRSRGQFVRCTGCDRCDDHHGWLADADGNLTGPCPTANDRAREAAA